MSKQYQVSVESRGGKFRAVCKVFKSGTYTGVTHAREWLHSDKGMKAECEALARSLGLKMGST